MLCPHPVSWHLLWAGYLPCSAFVVRGPLVIGHGIYASHTCSAGEETGAQHGDTGAPLEVRVALAFHHESPATVLRLSGLVAITFTC